MIITPKLLQEHKLLDLTERSVFKKATGPGALLQSDVCLEVQGMTARHVLHSCAINAISEADLHHADLFSKNPCALGGVLYDLLSVLAKASVLRRQLRLTSAVEDEFDIMLDPEDILEFTSYANAKTILAKYDITL